MTDDVPAPPACEWPAAEQFSNSLKESVALYKHVLTTLSSIQAPPKGQRAGGRNCQKTLVDQKTWEILNKTKELLQFHSDRAMEYQKKYINARIKIATRRHTHQIKQQAHSAAGQSSQALPVPLQMRDAKTPDYKRR